MITGLRKGGLSNKLGWYSQLTDGIAYGEYDCGVGKIELRHLVS
jgi:hypothetical protein